VKGYFSNSGALSSYPFAGRFLPKVIPNDEQFKNPGMKGLTGYPKTRGIGSKTTV
jgi:hypothetical protein